ncbi:MAG: P-loop NTPase [Solirubrobacteraceae bacterium]
MFDACAGPTRLVAMAGPLDTPAIDNMDRESMNDTTDAATILAPLWRRKLLILAVGLLVAAATYTYYKHQPAVYSATTQLDLGGGSEAQQLVGGSQGKTSLSSRALADAAALITSSGVSEAVRARLSGEHVASKDLGKVRAKAAAESYLVTITAEAHSAKAAARLANAYALTYLQIERSRYQREVQAAIANTRRQLHRIEAAQAASAAAARRTSSGKGSARAASPGGSSAVIQAASLASKVNQLESELSISSVQQVNPARPHEAQLISPTPRKNAIFGFVLGILLAGLAIVGVSRLDRRIQSLAQLQAIFKAQVLAALPRERSPIVLRDGQPAPAQSLLEPLRRLHTTLHMGELLERDRAVSPRVILFLSADSGDGKSTVVADLALTQSEAGARVAIVEADLRRPAQAGLLSVSPREGLAEVLAGEVTVEGAMHRVGATGPPLDVELGRSQAAVSTVLQAPSTGSLSVLLSGKPVANPPALLASTTTHELLRSVAADHDYVLIDAPPPLQVSDVMPLLHWVEGIVIVARMEHTRLASAEQLTRLLADSSTAPVLGVVANSVSRADINRHGFSSTYGERRWPRAR